jgi:hypothetical protein
MSTSQSPGANVYADLGFADAEEMLEKAGIARAIGMSLAEHRLTAGEAANLISVDVTTLDAIADGVFRNVSMAEMRAIRDRLEALQARPSQSDVQTASDQPIERGETSEREMSLT